MITEDKYTYALERIEELLPIVDGYDTTSKEATELAILSDIVMEYEEENFPIEAPTRAELITLAIEENHISQKELAAKVGVSPSRISEYASGKAEPSLKIAGKLCQILGISPSAMLGIA